MLLKRIVLFLLSLILFSCVNNTQDADIEEIEKIELKDDLIFVEKNVQININIQYILKHRQLNK